MKTRLKGRINFFSRRLFLKIGGVSFAVIFLLSNQFVQIGVSNARSIASTADPKLNPRPFQTPEPTPMPVSSPTPTAVATAAGDAGSPLEAAESNNAPNPCREFYVKATSYNLTGTKTFTNTNPGLGTIAVDPKFIPLGSVIEVPGYGKGIARDTGGGVKGLHIDVWLPGSEANKWGVKWLEVEVCTAE